MCLQVNIHNTYTPRIEIIELSGNEYSAVDVAKARSEAMNLAHDKQLMPIAIEKSKLLETISQWGLKPKNVAHYEEMMKGVNDGKIVFLKKSEYKQLKGTTPIRQTFISWLE